MNQVILLIAIPLLVAFSMPLTGKLLPRVSKVIALFTLLFEAIWAGFILFNTKGAVSVAIGGWLPPFGINLVVDHLSAVVAFVVSIVVLFSIFFQLTSGLSKKPNFYMLSLLLVAALMGIIFTGDLFNLFVFFEIAGITAYSLIASGKNSNSSNGALGYLIPASVASVFYLVGIALIYSTLGTLNMVQIAASFSTVKPILATFIAFSLLTLVLLEFEIFPFNSWVPRAYQGAPSSISAIFSSGLALASGYVMLRLGVIVFNGGQGGFIRAGSFELGHALFGIGVITVIAGEIAALAQKDVKKMLAFSSVGQMGMVLVAFSIGTHSSIYGGIFALISHSFAKLLLFLTAGLIIMKTGKSKYSQWTGIARRAPLLGVLILVGSLGVIGIPLFSGFWGKFAIIGSTVVLGKLGLIATALILAASVVEAFYFFRLVHTMFESSEEKAPKVKANFAFWLISSLLVAVIVALGLRPGIIDGRLKQIPGELIGNADSGYVQAVNKQLKRSKK
ncbi:MAG: proton-conducting transporter membrane subunit [Myxococcota bacterium]